MTKPRYKKDKSSMKPKGCKGVGERGSEKLEGNKGEKFGVEKTLSGERRESLRALHALGCQRIMYSEAGAFCVRSCADLHAVVNNDEAAYLLGSMPE